MSARRAAAAMIDDLHPEGIMGELGPDVEVGVGVDDPVSDEFAGQENCGEREDGINALFREELTDELPGRKNARRLRGKGDSCHGTRPSFRRAIILSSPRPGWSNPRPEGNIQTAGVDVGAAFHPGHRAFAERRQRNNPAEGGPSDQKHGSIHTGSSVSARYARSVWTRPLVR